MHSLRGWLLVAGGFLGVRGAVLPPSAPAITPAPQPEEAIVRMLQHRQDPNPISLAQVLLTALPLSLRIIAVTNIPAVSSILWEEFLDDKKPEWFLDLPEEIQSYLIVQFGPETAWPTAATTNDGSISQATTTATDHSSETGSSATDSASTDTASASPSGSESFSTVPSSTASISGTLSSSRSSSTSAASTNPSSSPSADVQAPPMSNAGLSREQKIGIGVGIPLGLLGLAALLFGCCFLLRRRRKRRDDGTEPPGSPGFIPRFSFQAEPTDYQTPLNPGHTHNHPSRFVEDMNEDEQSYEAAAIAASHGRDTFPPGGSSAGPTQPMSMHDPQPIMAPLLHTHSSRKARGKRTSYTSLHSVAEVTEPDDEMAESPILGRRNSPPKTGPRRPSIPSVLEMPPTPTAAAIKRKPVATSPTSSPAADAASRSLLRPSLAATTMANHSGSSSSGMAISSNSSSNSGFGHKTDSPVSPITDHTPVNPFSNDYAYLEDYGPEYSYNGYDDYDGGMYGGNRSLDRYPDLSAPRRYNSSSKTEWPLRNVFGSVKRNKSPMWDRVYESP